MQEMLCMKPQEMIRFLIAINANYTHFAVTFSRCRHRARKAKRENQCMSRQCQVHGRPPIKTCKKVINWQIAEANLFFSFLAAEVAWRWIVIWRESRNEEEEDWFDWMIAEKRVLIAKSWSFLSLSLLSENRLNLNRLKIEIHLKSSKSQSVHLF